jgi:hypothetical protein
MTSPAAECTCGSLENHIPVLASIVAMVMRHRGTDRSKLRLRQARRFAFNPGRYIVGHIGNFLSFIVIYGFAGRRRSGCGEVPDG